VGLRLSTDHARVLIEVWDADPRPLASRHPGNDEAPAPEAEGGRGLLAWRAPAPLRYQEPTRAVRMQAAGDRVRSDMPDEPGPASPDGRQVSFA